MTIEVIDWGMNGSYSAGNICSVDGANLVRQSVRMSIKDANDGASVSVRELRAHCWMGSEILVCSGEVGFLGTSCNLATYPGKRRVTYSWPTRKDSKLFWSVATRKTEASPASFPTAKV